MDTERLHEFNPKATYEQLSLDIMQADPELYKNQLLLLVKDLPWDRSVEHVQGGQAESLVKFCLDTNNLDPISNSLEKVFSENVDDPEFKAILDGVNNAKLPNPFAPNKINLTDEKKTPQAFTGLGRLPKWFD